MTPDPDYYQQLGALQATMIAHVTDYTRRMTAIEVKLDILIMESQRRRGATRLLVMLSGAVGAIASWVVVWLTKYR